MGEKGTIFDCLLNDGSARLQTRDQCAVQGFAFGRVLCLALPMVVTILKL